MSRKDSSHRAWSCLLTTERPSHFRSWEDTGFECLCFSCFLRYPTACCSLELSCTGGYRIASGQGQEARPIDRWQQQSTKVWVFWTMVDRLDGCWTGAGTWVDSNAKSHLDYEVVVVIALRSIIHLHEVLLCLLVVTYRDLQYRPGTCRRTSRTHMYR